MTVELLTVVINSCVETKELNEKLEKKCMNENEKLEKNWIKVKILLKGISVNGNSRERHR